MEFELLINLCRAAIFKESLSDNQEFSEVDLDKILNLASRQKVLPLLFAGLKRVPINERSVTYELASELKRFSLNKTLQNLNQTKELFRILNIFENNGIVAIPYKGVLLAHEAYENIGARSFSDMDLMVKKEDLDLITILLTTENYIHRNKMAPFFMQRFLEENCEFNFEFYEKEKRIYHIEPHWRIGQKMLQLDIDLNDLQSFIIEKNIFKEKIQAFTPDGILLTTCLHHFGKEQWLRLKHVCDIASILHKFGNEIDWNYLIEWSEKYSVANIIFLGIGVAKKVFNMNTPLKVEEELKRRKLSRFIAVSYTHLTLPTICSV